MWFKVGYLPESHPAVTGREVGLKQRGRIKIKAKNKLEIKKSKDERQSWVEEERSKEVEVNEILRIVKGWKKVCK